MQNIKNPAVFPWSVNSAGREQSVQIVGQTCHVNDYRKYESTCVSQHSASCSDEREISRRSIFNLFLKKRKEAEKQ